MAEFLVELVLELLGEVSFEGFGDLLSAIARLTVHGMRQIWAILS